MNLPRYREHMTNTLPFLRSVEPILLGAVVVRRAQDRMTQFAAKLRAGMDADKSAEKDGYDQGKIVPFAPRSRAQAGSEASGGPAGLSRSGSSALGVHQNSILIHEPANADRRTPLRVVEPFSGELRPAQARKRRMSAARDLPRMPDGTFVRTAGRVIARQAPQTASGFVSLSIEDETGISNILVAPELYEKVHLLAAGGRFIQVGGRLRNEGGSVQIRASRIRVFDTAHTPSRSLESL